MTDVTYNCCDGCGAECTLPATEFPPGWVRLPISRRWRCAECVKILKTVNAIQEDPVTMLSITLAEHGWPEAPKEEEK